MLCGSHYWGPSIFKCGVSKAFKICCLNQIHSNLATFKLRVLLCTAMWNLVEIYFNRLYPGLLNKPQAKLQLVALHNRKG